MNATELITAWDNMTNQDISDLPVSEEETEMIAAIVEHYRVCASCRREFDAHVSEDIASITDIVWKHRTSRLEDWVCDERRCTVLKPEFVFCSDGRIRQKYGDTQSFRPEVLCNFCRLQSTSGKYGCSERELRKLRRKHQESLWANE